MLTPRFSLSQDDRFLFVTIYAPFTHIDKTEVFMDENEFRFFSKPYYLRIHLPGPVIENEKASASWDSDTNSFNVKCPKLNEGEVFTGLDMLTDLLTPKGSRDAQSKIEVLPGGEDDDEEEEEDWYFEQKLPVEEEVSCKKTEDVGYGFAFRHTAVYSSLLSELGEILDIKDPDGLSQSERDNSRAELELRDFDSDHYLCDLHESAAEIESCLSSLPPFHHCIEGPVDLSQPVVVKEAAPGLAFSPGEQELLLALPRRPQSVPGEVLASVHYGLVDILYGYCFTLRVLGEDCVEAGWCCAKVSASLSGVARFRSARQVVISAIRRSLCYPLYRHYGLARLVWSDVIALLRVGKPALLKSLLALIPIFNNYSGHYVFNQLYINDYSVWIQTSHQSHLDALANVLHRTLENVKKRDIGLELEELEEAAELTLKEAEEEEKVDKISQVLNRVKVRDTDSDDTDSDTDSDSDDSSSRSELSDDK